MPKIEKFTADAIKRCKLPKGRDQLDYFENLSPGRSLILTLNKSGKRSWSALFYQRSLPRRRKLGEYPNLSCKEARKAALALNVDKAIASTRAGSFNAVADNYLERHVKKNGLRSASEITRLLNEHVRPRWGNKRFAEIRRRDVTELLDTVQDRHGSGVADSALAVLSGLMSWHMRRDDDYVSPIVRGMRRRGDVKRSRWLDDDEIRKLWAATEDAHAFGSIVRVLLLTGQRKSKVATMKWSDVDLDTGVWTIAREEREKGCPSQLTLPRTVLDIISARPRFAENEFIFAGRGTCFNAWSQSKARLDERLGFAEGWRLHDLRRTARALMTRSGVQTEVAELALGHTIQGVQAHYDDPREYRKRIDAALRKVEIEVQKIISPGAKVIKLPRRHPA